MRGLLIAEKPDLMRKAQEAYKKMSSYPDTIDFMSFAGHIMRLKSPDEYTPDWKVWKEETLPMIPSKFKYEVSPDKLKMFNSIKKQIEDGHYDFLINCCDPDREGQAIFHLFYDYIGCKLPVKRMWHDDLTIKEMQRAFNNLRDDLKDPLLANMTSASKLRGQFDWLIGMNFTRAFSLVAKKKTNLGRVMTPTLNIIVQRELEIKNFVPQNFWEIEGDFGLYKGTYFFDGGETKFFNKAEAESIMNALGKIGVIEDVKQKKETKSAPKLHNLSELQNEANRVYGYTLEETLDLAQSLYEKQILSYPRTDSQYLTEGTALDKDKGFKSIMLNSISCVPSLASYALTIGKDDKAINAMAKNKNYVDEKKVSSHYAIIPTGEKIAYNSLSIKEKNILELVCKRVLAIFMPPIILNKTTIVTDVDSKKFKSNGSVVVDKGFSVLYGTSFASNLLPKVTVGQHVDVKGAKLIEKVTTPPSRYTDETLNKAMENAGRFVDDKEYKEILKESKGLGTQATRAGIVSKLVDLEMITRKKKTISATDYGISIITNLADLSLKSPVLTAEWEEKLMKIEKSKFDAKTFYREMIDFVSLETKNILSMKISVTSSEKIGKCPKCGKDVVEGKDYYRCVGYKNSCDFVFGKNCLGAKVTKTDMKKILAGGESKEMSFSKKNTDGTTKKWKAKLVYKPETGKIGFSGATTSNSIVCPFCKKPLKISGKYYMCSEYKKSCEFILSKEFFEAKITESDLKKLLDGKTIEKEFTWKSKKKGKAKLKLVDGKYKLDFN